MRVLIIGAGNAGRNLAAKLCEERHDVVVIDKSGDALDEVQNQLDVQIIQGEGCSPQILESAGVAAMDLVVAVTNRDEVNILACVYAHSAEVRHTVARVTNPDFIKPNSRFDLQRLGIDLVISEKEECAREIFTILRMPGTIEAVDMLEGRVLAIGIKVHMDSPLVLQTLSAFPEPAMLEKVRFIALMRGEEVLIPRGDTQFMIGDDVYLVGHAADVSEFLEWACPEHSRFEKIVIGGGGDIGLHLAKLLEVLPMQVVLIERDEARAEECSKLLDRALVIKGDALEQDTIENVGVIKGTAFVAVTGSDENNIIISLLGEKAGANFTLAQVTKPEYVPIINGLSLLDRAVSSHMSMINAILHYIRGKNVKAAALLHKLPGELLEVDLPKGHRWAGKAIKELRMPDGLTIATALRNNEVQSAVGDLKLQAGDRLVLFALPRAVAKVTTLFGL